MRTLRLGSKGDDVAAWQTFLKGAGLLSDVADGSFGPRTLDATRAFQRAHQLGDDGLVGSLTLGVAMQAGFNLVPDDPPLPGGPQDGVTFFGDDWQPPPAPSSAALVIKTDPRVITNHAVGVLPCPTNPRPPAGFAYWKGQVPADAGALAVKVEFHPADFPMGTFVQALLGTQVVGARVEWHDVQGATGKTGCFRGTSLFRKLDTV